MGEGKGFERDIQMKVVDVTGIEPALIALLIRSEILKKISAQLRYMEISSIQPACFFKCLSGS